MRITAAHKAATRARILQAAHRMFTKQGFATVTTRDIAKAAGIATGTLFNYFTTKEAIAVALAASDLAAARAEWDAGDGRAGPLDEGLFTLIINELRALEPHRGYIGPILESARKSLPSAADDPDMASLRAGHLERVRAILKACRPAVLAGNVTEHMYWTLYSGVLAFWAADPMPDHDETLAVLDHSVRAFVGWLDASAPQAAPTRSRKRGG
jgi:AcrR family transcriptional regulator